MSSKQESKRVHEKTKRHGLIRVLSFAAIIVVVVYVGYSIITDNIQIRNNKQKLAELTEQTAAIQAQNEQINGYLENDKNLEGYIEDIARDKLDYANADERIYYVVPAGN